MVHPAYGGHEQGKIRMTADELVIRMINGERDFRRIALQDGRERQDLTIHPSYAKLDKYLHSLHPGKAPDFCGPQPPQETFNFSRAQLDGLYAPGLFLPYIIAQGCSFRGAVLDGATLSHAHLRGAGLEGASLCHANLYQADLHAAFLDDAVLDEADLDRVEIHGANLLFASLRWASLRYACASTLEASGADFTGADLTGINLEYSVLEGANFSNADMSRAKMLGLNTAGADFRGIKNLDKAFIIDGGSLDGAKLDEQGRRDMAAALQQHGYCPMSHPNQAPTGVMAKAGEQT